jgi:hypothetical protein
MVSILVRIQDIVEQINGASDETEDSKGCRNSYEEASRLIQLIQAPCSAYGEEEGKVDDEVLGPLARPHGRKEPFGGGPTPYLLCSFSFCHSTWMITSFNKQSQRPCKKSKLPEVS